MRVMPLLRALTVAFAAAFVAGVTTAAQRAVPTPESIIGFSACADHKLATYEQSLQYFRALAAASNRLRLVEIGRTMDGRPQVMAIISSEANLAQLERYKQTAARLAKARDVTEAEARALAAQGKAVVWIDMGIHAVEVAPAQLAPELARRLVTDDTAAGHFIRDNVIVLLVPNVDPDGTTRVAEWFAEHGPKGFVQPPDLEHRYVGSDLNRDWYMFNMLETRNLGRQLYHEWFPQIVYNQHQAGQFPARIFIPPFADPTNPNIPPLVMRGINIVGAAMSRRLQEEGKSGVVSGMAYDTWWNGGMRSAPYFHNMVGILTETQHPSPIPTVYDAAKFPDTFSDGTPTTTPTVYYPDPYRGGPWRFRDSCEYNYSASFAVLEVAAQRREEWLFDIYQMGRTAIASGAGEEYLVPAEQWDRGTAAKLINALRHGGIDVERATAPFVAGGRSYAAGSYRITGQQAFLPHIRDVLTPQTYTHHRAPYDIAGWTLPIQMGVRVDRLTGTTVTGSFEPVAMAVPPSSVVHRATAAYVADGRANDAFRLINQALAAGETVFRTAGDITVNGAIWPAGTFIVPVRPATHAWAEAAALEGVPIAALDALPRGEMLHVRAPRVGVYRAWTLRGNTDEGWTRWLLEQFGFSIKSIRDTDLRADDLRNAYDVVVLPNAPLAAMLHGNPPDSAPEQYVGGMGVAGAAALHKFVTAGGTLLALDQATALPVSLFGLPVRNVLDGVRPADFLIPGSLLRVHLDPAHPIAFGLPPDAAAFFARSPAFEIGRERTDFEDDIARDPPSPAGVQIVGRYPSTPVLLSGWMLGERRLAGRAAIVEVPLGAGRVILLGFRTQHRGQAHGTFKLLFNSLYRATSAPRPQP